MSYSDATRKLDAAVRGGTRHALLAQCLSQLVSLASLAVLYRFVDRSDYGLLGMAMPLVVLPRMMATLGLSAAAVQRAKLSDGHSTALFWLNVVLGTAAGVLTIGVGYLLADVYGTPALSGVCLALAGTSLVAVLGTQHQALLERRMLIGRLAALRIGGQLSGAITSIVLAIYGWGVWALVVQQYVEMAIITVGVWSLERWRPGKWPAFRELRSLVAFGGYYSLSSLFFYAAQNADKVILSVVMGASTTGRQLIGMYAQAYHLMMRPVYVVTTPLTTIMLPGLSRAMSNQSLFADLVARFYRIVAILLLPAGVGLLVVGRDVMLVLGGTAWSEAGWLLTVMAPIVMAQGFVNIAGSVLAAAGRADRLFFGSVLTAVVLVQAALAGYWLGKTYTFSEFGMVMSVATAVTAAQAVVLGLPYLLYCFGSVGISWRKVLGGLRRPALAAALMGCLVTALRRLLLSVSLPAVVELPIVVVSGAGFYWLMAQGDVQWLWRELRSAPDLEQ